MSNMVAAHPGTHIFEFLTDDDRINLCYRLLALRLGMNWTGMSSSRVKGGRMLVDVDLLIRHMWQR